MFCFENYICQHFNICNLSIYYLDTFDLVEAAEEAGAVATVVAVTAVDVEDL